MVNVLAGKFGGVPFKYFGDWTDRIAKGELPFAKPPRPQGVERNIVITTWDWGNEKQYLHDLISSDKRNPTVNAYGPLYGSTEYATDHLPVLDPKTARSPTSRRRKVRMCRRPSVRAMPPSRSRWRPRPIGAWSRSGTPNSTITTTCSTAKGRVWLTGTNHAPGTPAFCRKGSDNPYAKAFPLDTNERQLAMFDPKTKKFTFIDTCFGTHHLQFGFDKDNTLWTSGGGPWPAGSTPRCSTRPASAEKAQGWAPFVLDTNGNGKLDDYTKPGQPMDPSKDMRVGGSGTYAVMPNPVDGSIWYTGRRVRRQKRRHPLRSQDQAVGGLQHPDAGLRPARRRYRLQGRGLGVARQRPSRQLRPLASARARSTARRRPAINARKAGRSTNIPAPASQGIGDNSAEASYYTWVDQHNAVGLGKDVPISTANENDGFAALVDGKMVMLRVPYPLSFYAKGLDARIDDPKAGWKGRGLWSSEGDRTPWLKEGGKGMTPMAVHIQIRPDPLARLSQLDESSTKYRPARRSAGRLAFAGPRLPVLSAQAICLRSAKMVREPILTTIDITDLRPTQITVGMREVMAKRKRWRETPIKKGRKVSRQAHDSGDPRAETSPLRHRSSSSRPRAA